MKKIVLIMFLLCTVIFGSEWKVANLVDEFGDKTGEIKIFTNIENGTFSNSATSDSKLDGFIKIGVNSISFNTYEYGYSKGVESNMKDITVKMKNSDNEILSIKLNSMNVFDFPEYKSYNAKKIKDFIKKSYGEIKVIIYGKYSTIQKFSFNANGYTKSLKLIKKKPIKKKKETLQHKDGLAYEKNKEIPYTGEWIDYFENGKINWKENYKDGKLNGIRVAYYENGQVLVKVNFKNGERNGEQIMYHKNGKVEDRTNFKTGKQNGESVWYYENGKIRKKSTYKDNLENGKSITYYENGKINFETNYKDGKENGKRIKYHENGIKWYESTYKDGEQIGESTIF